jgi:adenylylsulfate kinase
MQSINTVWHHATVTRHRRNQQNNHKSAVLWFTGLSGSGKSTLAHCIEEELYQLGCRTIVLDGDNVRHGLCGDLGFSDVDRKENLRRIGEMSKLFVEAGVITLTAFISPFSDDRNRVKSLMNQSEFIEIFVDCSIDVCEKRDTKGLYKKARKGEVANFTGISSPYEPPENPDLVVDTGSQTLDESAKLVMNLLIDRGIINNEN